MFNTGDTVSYGTSGVCTIAEKKRLTLGGQPHECFILRPVFDASMNLRSLRQHSAFAEDARYAHPRRAAEPAARAGPDP